MVTTDLRVIFEDATYFEYQNPPSGTCLHISNCRHWKRASALYVKHLRPGWIAVFFEDGHCMGSENDAYWFATDKVLDGFKSFPKLKTVRSIRLRPIEGNIPSEVVPRCVALSYHAFLTESMALNETTIDVGTNFTTAHVESTTDTKLV